MTDAFPDAVPELTDGVVVLRELSEADIPAWFERATDEESADLAGDPVPDSIDGGRAWLERHRERFRQRTAIRWGISEPGSAACMGTVGLSARVGVRHGAELAVVVARAHWGKGVGTAAVRLATRYAFETLGVVEVHAEVLRRNAASRRLLEKVGFRFDHETPADGAASGDDEDLYTYVLHDTDAAIARGTCT